MTNRGAAAGSTPAFIWVKNMDKKYCEGMLKRAQSTREKVKTMPVKGRCIGIPLGRGERDVYFYRSDKARAGAVIVLHGGGFLFGSARNCDRYCLEIQKKTDRHVIALDYITSDLEPYPAALEDVCDAVRFFSHNASIFGIDKNHIALLGHSAGANLAAAAALSLNAGAVDALVLDYPYLDQTDRCLEIQGQTVSESSKVFRELYSPPEKRGEAAVSPLYAQDEMLLKLPGTAIFCAENDVLRYEGECFAKRLESLGTHVLLRVFEGVEHAFIEREFDLSEETSLPHRREAAMKVIELTAQFLEQRASE